MSAWLYRKPEATHIRGLCVICNNNLQKHVSNGKYQALCNPCDRLRYPSKRKRIYNGSYKKPYRKYKLNICNRCGFIAKHPRQMDVHHIDHNHHNNDPNNLETLCANCHRLEHC